MSAAKSALGIGKILFFNVSHSQYEAFGAVKAVL